MVIYKSTILSLCIGTIYGFAILGISLTAVDASSDSIIYSISVAVSLSGFVAGMIRDKKISKDIILIILPFLAFTILFFFGAIETQDIKALIGPIVVLCSGILHCILYALGYKLIARKS